LKRLDEQARNLERHARGPSLEKLIAEESDLSHSYGGRSVFGWEPPPTSGFSGGQDGRKVASVSE
jgi:hypothetical protein